MCVHLPLCPSLLLTNHPPFRAQNGGQTSLIHFQTKFVPYEELKRRFFAKLAEQFDSDGNGTINLMEFATLLDELGSTLSEEQAETIFQSDRKSTRLNSSH